MEKSKKNLLDVIYGLAVFGLLSTGFYQFINHIRVIYKNGFPSVESVWILIIIFFSILSAQILTIVSFFLKSRGVKISALVSQGALFLITITLILVYFGYIGFLQIALYSALIFLMDMLVYKSWKLKDASKPNEYIEKSKNIVSNVIYGSSAIYLFSIIGRLVFIIFSDYSMHIANTSIEWIIRTITVLLVLVLTAISFFSKNRVISILALVCQGITLIGAIVLIFIEEYVYMEYEQIAICSIIFFLMDMFVNKIWKAKQDISKLDKPDMVDINSETT